MCDGQHRRISAHCLPKRLLDHGVRLIVYSQFDKSKFAQRRMRARHYHAPMAEVASSRMSSLLCRAIALARARICRCPTDRLPPPLEICVSRVMRPPSSSPCREKRPEARRASFSTASSNSENGSRFWRRVPLRSSGYAEFIRSACWSGLIVVRTVLTIWGIIVILDRSASRLMESVRSPS